MLKLWRADVVIVVVLCVPLVHAEVATSCCCQCVPTPFDWSIELFLSGTRRRAAVVIVVVLCVPLVHAEVETRSEPGCPAAQPGQEAGKVEKGNQAKQRSKECFFVTTEGVPYYGSKTLFWRFELRSRCLCLQLTSQYLYTGYRYRIFG